MNETNLSAERLRELLHYNQETGLFTWRVRSNSRVNAGDIAGNKRKDGYLQISVLGGQYLSHRLAWLYAHGKWPAAYIDHIDGCRNNNLISNLRDVSRSVNNQNQRLAHRNSTHGLLGVSQNGKRWMAQIRIDGKKHFLGRFETPELAHEAYLSSKRKLHQGCTL